MLLILLHLSLRRARLDKTVKTPETTNKKHGILEEVPLTSWARLLGGLLLRPIPCRLCEKKNARMEWNVSHFMAELFSCSIGTLWFRHIDVGSYGSRPEQNMYWYCIWVPNYVPCILLLCTWHIARMYLAYRTHASCTHVPCVPHPDNMRTLNAVPSCLSVPQMLYPCTLRTVPVHPAYRTSAPCVPYQCTLRTVPVYPAYRTQTTCVPWTLYPVAFLYLKCRTHVPCVPYPCTLRTVPVHPAYRTPVPKVAYRTKRWKRTQSLLPFDHL